MNIQLLWLSDKKLYSVARERYGHLVNKSDHVQKTLKYAIGIVSITSTYCHPHSWIVKGSGIIFMGL